MSRQRVTARGAAVVQFFESYLPAQRGLSRHTICSYRDAVVMLLQFLGQRRGCGIEALDLDDLDAAAVEAFLRHLELERHNSVRPRAMCGLPQSTRWRASWPIGTLSAWVRGKPSSRCFSSGGAAARP